MEWVETTAKTVDEAKELALDKLGVDETDTEFEILEQPKQGLFGRVRGEARVRARVTPKSPRAKEERRDRKRRPAKAKPEADAVTANVSDSEEAPRSSGRKAGQTQGGGNGRGRNGGGSEAGATRKRPAERPRAEDAPMEDVANSVQEFLDGLTAAFGIDTAVTLETDDESIMAHIEGKHGLLLGPKARTLDAIQELTRVTAQRAAPSSIRIKVDVGGYREARREALASFAQQAADRAMAEGIEVVLEPMNSADRKVIHDALTDVAGVSTRSAGNDPSRRVVVVPDGAGDGDGVDGSDVEDSSGDDHAS